MLFVHACTSCPIRIPCLSAPTEGGHQQPKRRLQHLCQPLRALLAATSTDAPRPSSLSGGFLNRVPIQDLLWSHFAEETALQRPSGSVDLLSILRTARSATFSRAPETAWFCRDLSQEFSRKTCQGRFCFRTANPEAEVEYRFSSPSRSRSFSDKLYCGSLSQFSQHCTLPCALRKT